jgi:hypothetical protein
MGMPSNAFADALSALVGIFGFGAFFPTSFLACMYIVRRLGWLPLDVGSLVIGEGVVLLFALFPLSYVGFLGVSIVVVSPLFYLLPGLLNALSGPGSSYRASNAFFALLLVLASPVPAFLFARALQSMTERWDRVGFRLLLVASATTVPAGMAVGFLFNPLAQGIDFLPYLFPVGNAFFGTLGGYWFLRTCARPSTIAK